MPTIIGQMTAACWETPKGPARELASTDRTPSVAWPAMFSVIQCE